MDPKILIQKIMEELADASEDAPTLAQRILSAVHPSLFMEEKQESPPALEPWQERELAALLSPKYESLGAVATAVEGDVLYLRPEEVWGQRRYHMVIWDNGLTLEQTDYAKQYPPRIALDPEEVEPFLRQLLLWYLESSRPTQTTPGDTDTGLGEIEDNPF